MRILSQFQKIRKTCKPDSVSRYIGTPVIYLRFTLLQSLSWLPLDIGRAALSCRYTYHCTA